MSAAPRPTGHHSPDPVSLLWPRETAAAVAGEALLDASCARDLGLPALVASLGLAGDGRRAVEQALLRPPRDPLVIRYRQDILADMLANPALENGLAELLPAMQALTHSRYATAPGRNTLHEVIWRLGELESLVAAVDGLRKAFAGLAAPPASAGLQALAGAAQILSEDETYGRLARELPGLLAEVRTTASLTIGVNLDHNLQPIAATLLAINDQPFREPALLGRLFGRAAAQWEGIAPLHAVPPHAGPANGLTPMMVPLFRDLAEVLERSAQPIASALGRYTAVTGAALERLGQELPFYLAAARLVTWLQERGLPVCRPELAPEEERICEVSDAYNLNLALRLGEDAEADLATSVVTNDIAMGPAGRVLVLTGPNQGGKTTYVQAIGLAQVLAQAGFYVPGRAARISPVDAIFTHFPAEEGASQGAGRFGDEARRLADIFGRVTRHSLLLFNETLSSTSAGEGLYLGQDILRVLRLLGARAIFATHLHELAAGIDRLNAEPGEGTIASLVASPVPAPAAETGQGPVPAHRSYKIVAGPPLGRSYARDIAGRYGVSYEQLRVLLEERGQIS